MITRHAKALHGMCLLLAVGLAQAAPFGYVVNSDSLANEGFDSLYRVDLATGEATLIGPTGFSDVEGLAISSAGVLYGIDDASKTLITLDTQTGQGSAVGSGSGNTGLPVGIQNGRDFGLGFDTEGNLWLSSDVTGQVWLVDPASGAVTLVSGTAEGSTSGSDGAKSLENPGSLTGLAACGTDVYGLGSTGDHSLYRLTSSGTAQLVGPLGAALVFGDAGLDFDGNGNLWGIADRSADLSNNELNEPSIIFRVNAQTGAAERVAETIVGVESLAIAPPAPCLEEESQHLDIPVLHPAGLAALILGLLGLGWRAGRSRLF